jgi:hypothetical protein
MERHPSQNLLPHISPGISEIPRSLSETPMERDAHLQNVLLRLQVHLTKHAKEKCSIFRALLQLSLTVPSKWTTPQVPKVTPTKSDPIYRTFCIPPPESSSISQNTW